MTEQYFNYTPRVVNAFKLFFFFAIKHLAYDLALLFYELLVFITCSYL